MKENKKLETIIVLVMAFIVCYWMFKKPYLLVCSLTLGSIGLFFQEIAAKIHWAWMKLSHALGFVMSRVILTFVFFVILLPLSLLARMSGRKNIQLRAGASSYFKTRDHSYVKENMENIW